MKNKKTLEEAAEKYHLKNQHPQNQYSKKAFIEGAKWKQENSYSEEEVEQIARFGFDFGRRVELKAVDLDFTFDKWFKQFSKLKNG